MQVKVVLFPEGEDPDSFSKKNSTTELEAYIQKNNQDFISFKADILLKDSNNDPIKRAELIREIVHSVSLIPDQITRTVYLQQIAQQFDMSEQILSNELIKSRKNTVAKQLQEPSLQDLPIEKQTDLDLSPNNTPTVIESLHDEFNLIRLMVKYGTRVVKTEQVGDNGEVNTVETSVIELIHHELSKDNLTFSHPLYHKVYQLFVDALNDNNLLAINYLKRLEDQAIVQFVANIESNDYELSTKWLSNYNIETRTESDRLSEALHNSILGFKSYVVESRIREIRQQLSNESLTDEDMMALLAEQMAYERVKIVFAEKLGRIVLR
jgi:DNA primase